MNSAFDFSMRLFLAIEKMFVIIGRIGGIAQLVRAAES